MNVVARRSRPKSAGASRKGGRTQAYLQSVEEAEREKPRRARGSDAAVEIYEQSELEWLHYANVAKRRAHPFGGP